MARSCVFCSGLPLTKEHVLPRWLEGLFPENGKFDLLIESNKPRREHHTQAPKLTAEVRQVCKSCNTGWMHDLEIESQPILQPLIRGQRGLLEPSDQRLIVRWAMKTALMADLLYPPEARIMSAKHYPDFFKRREPSEPTHVLVGRYVGPISLGYYSHHVARQVNGRIVGASKASYCSTLLIGHLVLNLTRVGEDQDATMTLGTEMAQVVFKVWPPSGLTLPWPPTLTLDHLSLMILCRAPVTVELDQDAP